MKYRVLALSLAWLLVWCVPRGSAAVPFTLVQWSDIHYGNEEYQPAAWAQAWKEGTAAHPGLAAFTGDQVDNKCSRDEFVHRLDGFLADLHARLVHTHTRAVFCLGNNDVVDNYQSTPEDLHITLSAYRKHFGSDCYLDDLGNGRYPEDVAGCRWLTLNSVIFSSKDHYSGRAEQARHTLDWLASEVQACAPSQTLMLVMHVPPVRDILDDKLAWYDDEAARLVDILRQHPGPVCILAGHFHRNEIHALQLGTTRAVPILLAGSLSGKFGGVPNWRTYQVTLSGTSLGAIHYTVRYPQHDDWTTTYQVESPTDVGSYLALQQRLTHDDSFYRQYMADFYAHNSSTALWTRSSQIHASLVDELLEQVPSTILDPRPATSAMPLP